MSHMFTSATAYDRMMGRWSRQLAPLFLDFTGIQAGERFLDVGCGTGSLLQVVAERMAGSRITGIDPAQPFIDHCRRRFPNTRFAFDCGDAMALPYLENSFDHSLSLLVFMFIPEPEKAASEMRRVTRPGGIVSACTWDSASQEMNLALWDEARKLDPAVEDAGFRKLKSNRKGELLALWRAVGFEDAEEIAINIEMEFGSFDDYWSPFTGGVGPQGVYVASLSIERQEALREALRSRLLGARSDGPISLKARAWAVRGTVL